METLIVNKATKKDLAQLINYAQKIGIDVAIAPKKIVKPKPDKKKLAEIVSKINKAATKRMIEVHNINL